MRLSVLVADDEYNARKRLTRLLSTYKEIEVVAEAEDGQFALTEAKKHKPDLIFLDIRMPRLNGIEVAELLNKCEHIPYIIFTTALEEYALRAFEVSATDYLLKPIRSIRLEQSISRVKKLIENADTPPGSSHPYISASSPSHIPVFSRGKDKLIPIEQIHYFKSDNKYTTIFSGNNEYLSDISLIKLEQMLKDDVVRVHRNAIVMKHHILGIERDKQGTFYIILKDIGTATPISRRHVSSIRKMLRSL